MKKTILDDGFQSYLTENAELVGEAGIPNLLDLKNTQIPKALVPFNKINKENDKNKYVHFYIHDYQFSQVLTATRKYVDKLKQFDGVITPDCSMLIGQSTCLQQTNTYFNRAVGFIYKDKVYQSFQILDGVMKTALSFVFSEFLNILY